MTLNGRSLNRASAARPVYWALVVASCCAFGSFVSPALKSSKCVLTSSSSESLGLAIVPPDDARVPPREALYFVLPQLYALILQRLLAALLLSDKTAAAVKVGWAC